MATPAASPKLEQDPKANGLYNRDFYSWTVQQSMLMRRNDFAAIDWDNVIEEMESMAIEQRNRWEKHCARTIEHLLKIEYYREATDKVLKHWMREVMDFRQEMAELIEKNPGLKGEYAEMMADAWKRGRRYARRRLAEYAEDNDPQTTWKKAYREWDSLLPAECPYRIEDIAAFDPSCDREPRIDAWPPSVARVLNTRLDEDLPVGRGRMQDRGIDWGR